jgi:hypothetical protein
LEVRRLLFIRVIVSGPMRVGIKPVEGVLDREPRDPNRYAGGVVLAWAVATRLERVATRRAAASVESSSVAVRCDRGRQILRWNR